ncbi:MAG: N-acetylmuramoyl-L-alanine amidase [Pseudomonadota bacterium]
MAFRIRRIIPVLALLISVGRVAADDGRTPFTVVLDPGHGGTDAGVRRDPLTEKGLTLDIARRVETILKGRPEIRVLLTRTDDTRVSSDDRKKLGNANPAGIYISLHFASASDPALRGPRVYVLPPPTVSGTRSALPKADQAHAWSLSESWKLAKTLSRTLAPQEADGLARIAPLPLVPLLGVTVPCTLVEIDYLTAADSSRWSDPVSVEATAQQIASAITLYQQPVPSLDPAPPAGNNPPP